MMNYKYIYQLDIDLNLASAGRSARQVEKRGTDNDVMEGREDTNK